MRKYLLAMSLLVIAIFVLLSQCDEHKDTSHANIRPISIIKPLPRRTVMPDLIARGPQDSIYVFQEYTNNTLHFGFKNRTGKTIIPAIFDMAGNFDGYLGPVIKGKKQGFCDSTGTIIYTLEDLQFATRHNEMTGENYFDGHAEGLFEVVDKKGKHGYVNSKAQLVIPCQFEDAERFSDGMAVYYENDEEGFINSSGEIVVKAKYEDAFPFSEGLAAVRINDKTGFIDRTGKLVIPAVYAQGYVFSEGLAVVTKSGDYTSYFYIDSTGKVVIPGPFENAAPFVNGEALIEKRGKCKVIDKTGTVLRSGGEECFVGC